MLLSEKLSGQLVTRQMRRVPLTARPMDFVYFSYFASHLVASFLIDLQWLYPSSLCPQPLRALLEYYVAYSNDPLIGGLAGIKDDSTLLWFKTFITLEGVFQIPVFILGLSALWKGGKKIYPLLLIYAVEAATTTLPCLVYILSLPPPGTGTTTFDSALTFEQRLILLSGYAPFFLVPLIMLLDIGGRVYKLVSKGLKMEAEKWE